MPKYIELNKGDKYGRLEVLSFHHFKKYLRKNGVDERREYYLCKCDCGKETIVEKPSLRNGNTKSCGCLDLEKKTKHGMFGTRIYNIWIKMKERCTNPKNAQYKNYGGRGIKYCDEWKNFENFYEWANNNGYSENLTIDRIDVNGNYEPTNCRWATIKEQNRNKRNNRIIEYNGETKCLSEWAEKLGIRYGLLSLRLSRGWKVKRAFSQKILKKHLTK